MKEQFDKNYVKILDFVEGKMNEPTNGRLVHTTMYSLSNIIDYKLLHTKLLECRKNIDDST
jgi:hypothetical protein